MKSTAQLARDPQAQLPTGPTHVAFRATRTQRTAEQIIESKAFLAAAGRVEFGRLEGRLQEGWMALCRQAAKGTDPDSRVCCATMEHVSELAKHSKRTQQRFMPIYVERGLVQADHRKGGHQPTAWLILLPASVMAGVTACHGRGDSVSPDIRNTDKREKARPLQGRRASSNVRAVRTVRTPKPGTPAPPLEAVAAPLSMDEVLEFTPPAGGEPGPNQQAFIAQIQTLRKGKRRSYRPVSDTPRRKWNKKNKDWDAITQAQAPLPRGACAHERATGGFCEACDDDIRLPGEAY